MKRTEFQIISRASSIHLRLSAPSAVDSSYQTKPMACSGGWVEKAGEIPPEPTSQTNPLVRYDVLSSEKHRYSGGWGFPDRSQHVSESNDQVFDRASVPTKRTQIVDAPRAGWVAWERARVFAERHVLESRWFIYRDETG
jgi:hypothetical protein